MTALAPAAVEAEAALAQGMRSDTALAPVSSAEAALFIDGNERSNRQ